MVWLGPARIRGLLSVAVTIGRRSVDRRLGYVSWDCLLQCLIDRLFQETKERTAGRSGIKIDPQNLVDSRFGINLFVAHVLAHLVHLGVH